jgi:hypothetical protein
MKTKKGCRASKQDGSACGATALSGSEFCFFHDPSKASDRRAAQSLGGQGNRIRTLSEATPDVKIENSADVVALICETINQVRKGCIDPRVANAVGYLANLATKAMEQNELETRIAKLEGLFERRTADLNGRQT